MSEVSTGDRGGSGELDMVVSAEPISVAGSDSSLTSASRQSGIRRHVVVAFERLDTWAQRDPRRARSIFLGSLLLNVVLLAALAHATGIFPKLSHHLALDSGPLPWWVWSLLLFIATFTLGTVAVLGGIGDDGGELRRLAEGLQRNARHRGDLVGSAGCRVCAQIESRGLQGRGSRRARWANRQGR